MTHPPQPTAAPPGEGPGARTQEMPAVPPPPPGATGTAELPASAAPAAAPAAAPPMDGTHDLAPFIPGFGAPGPAGARPPVAPASSRRWSYGPRLRALAIGVALVGLAILLLLWGLSVGREPLWSTASLWSAFATVCTLSVLAAFVPDAPGRGRLQPRLGWRIGLAGLAGLAVFWAFVALPQAASDRGFLLTAALAAAAGALWTSPNRPATIRA